MSDAPRQPLEEIHSLDEIPEFATEEEEARFWSTHSLGQRLLDSAEPPPPDQMPPVRGPERPIAVPFERDTIRRLRSLAEKKGTPYRTLLERFILERLDQEEKREGIIG